MATTRRATTRWTGDLMSGTGEVTMASSGTGSFPVSWPSRAEEPNGRTSPEELIAGAHSACFSMALAHRLAGAGSPPAALDTSAEVDFVPGTGITAIRLGVRGQVPGITAETFQSLAEEAKAGCPVSQALAGVPITLSATLVPA